MSICLSTACQVSAPADSREFVCSQRGGDIWLRTLGLLRDDYLVFDVSANTVKWYLASISTPYRVYSCPSRPLCASFCGMSMSPSTTHFDKSNSELAVVVLGEDKELYVYISSGERYEVSLPKDACSLLSTPCGLVIECKVSSVFADEHRTSWRYYSLPSVYSPLSLLSFESVGDESSSLEIIAAYENLLCTKSSATNTLQLVQLVSKAEALNHTKMDDIQQANLSMMSGMVFMDRTAVSEASSRSMERFMSLNSSNVSAGSGGHYNGGSGGRVINVGQSGPTRQRSINRSSPSPTQHRGARVPSPFHEYPPHVSNVGQTSSSVFHNSSTLQSLLGVQQNNQGGRQLRNDSRPAVSSEKHSVVSGKTATKSPKGSLTEQEEMDDLLDFDFLELDGEDSNVVFGEGRISVIPLAQLTETSELDFLSSKDATAFFVGDSSSQEGLYLYVLIARRTMFLYRLELPSATAEEDTLVVKLIKRADFQADVTSSCTLCVSYNIENELARPLPLVLVSTTATDILSAPIGSTAFTSLIDRKHSEVVSHQEIVEDDDAWIDSIIGQSKETHRVRIADSLSIVSPISSIGHYFAVSTGEPSPRRTIHSLSINSSSKNNWHETSILHDLILQWKYMLSSQSGLKYAHELTVWLNACLLCLTFGSGQISSRNFLTYIMETFSGNQSSVSLPAMNEFAWLCDQPWLSGSAPTSGEMLTMIVSGMKIVLNQYFLQGTTILTAKGILLLKLLHEIVRNTSSTLSPSITAAIADVLGNTVASSHKLTIAMHDILTADKGVNHGSILGRLLHHMHSLSDSNDTTSMQVDNTSPIAEPLTSNSNRNHHWSAPRMIIHAFLKAVPECTVEWSSTSLLAWDEGRWKQLLRRQTRTLQHVLELARIECHADADPSWPPAVLIWVGRADLYANRIGDTYVVQTSSRRSDVRSTFGTATGDNDDGLDELEATSLLRFPDDNRMHEVCRLLRSSKPMYLKVERSAEISDLDHRAKSLERLSHLLNRSFACPVGRGMLTIASAEPLMAEKLPIPILSVQGRVPPANSLLTLDNLTDNAATWPEFHNGTAAALRVGPKVMASALRANDANPSSSSHDNNRSRQHGMRAVTRNWIMYNKTAAQATTHGENTHAGFLFGLGLFGHLHVITITDICDYLTQGHEATTIAVLLGVSISKLGSVDSLVSKTLFLHLPSLIPTPHWGIEISPMIQCASLVGIGFLFCKSNHRLMAQFLLEELFRAPTSERCECRESHALCAAWALAMIVLPRQQSHPTGEASSTTFSHELADMKIDERLFQLIIGGKKPSDLSNLFSPSSQAFTHPGAADANAKSSRILEGDNINTDVTSPGATLALALLYMRSNHDKILRRLDYPSTLVELDLIRPDHLLYRALARSLIMWDQGVTPTVEWMEAQLPHVLLQSRREHLAQREREQSLLSGKGAPADAATTHAASISHKKYFGPYGASRKQHSHVLDAKATLTLIVHLYAGLCLGIGLIYAGTFDEKAKTLLLNQLRWLQNLRENKTKENYCVDKMAKYTVESAQCSVSLALACVMAGSGDVECLQMLRILRWKTDAEQSYGSHMAYNMAIGLLFLGGGKFSLKRDPVSIACLLLSILPRYPMRASDHKHHLQALRHLYVLAVEPRVLQTIDVDSGVPVSVDLELELTNGECITTQAPGLLPELRTIRRISVKAQQSQQNRSFYPCSLDLSQLTMRSATSTLYNPLSASSSVPSKLMEDEEQWASYDRFAAVQRCAVLPPFYVKVRPSAVDLAQSLAMDADVPYQEESRSESLRQTVHSLLESVFRTDAESVMEVELANEDVTVSESVVQKVNQTSDKIIASQLLQCSTLQELLQSVLMK